MRQGELARYGIALDDVLAAVAVLTGVVMLAYINQLREQRMAAEMRVDAEQQLRPVPMIASVGASWTGPTAARKR